MIRQEELPRYFLYWGKAKRDNSKPDYQYHLLPFHCLDVAAVADAWLQGSNVLLKQMSQQMKLSPKAAKPIILFFVLLHDLGKFDARFQHFCEDIRQQLQGSDYEVEQDLVPYSHGSYGYQHFRRMFRISRCEPMKAVAGHHGYCDLHIQYQEPDADEELVEMDDRARHEWVQFCLDWLGIDAIPEVSDIPMLAGFCSVADWIGSSITNFTTDPTLNLQEYYNDALKRAELALTEFGVITSLNGAGFAHLFEGYQPRGVQTLLGNLPLTHGLTIVEADTGSGKTEFALAYASLLIHASLADGIVFGLPTQATANGLFERIGEAAKRLFPDATVTLAHSKAKYLMPDEQGFLHQSNKRAFLGSMSVATVDQILMGVLGIKHQFVRSFGTRKSVLVLDEIHSFDAYMVGLIDQVLKGQHEAFGSVILLSATLPEALKEQLLSTYGGQAHSAAYPLITHVDQQGNTQEWALPESALRMSKTIQCECWYSKDLLPTCEQMIAIANWVKGGAVVCVICNTVQDAQNLYTRVMNETNISNVDLFHARYTFDDRARIEQYVLNNYGKQASRAGRVLIATQVVEQSLDLDFDILISQIAPIEFLMQRMGRLWRHDRENTNLCPRTSNVAQPTFITMLPSGQANDWKQYYRGSGYVYRNIRLLHRTQKYLEQHNVLVFPDCYRPVISFVHHEAPYDDEPQELTALTDKYKMDQEGSLYTARKNSNLASKPLNDVDPRCALLTREGEMTATVVLMKTDGSLLHGGDFTEQHDRERSSVYIKKKHAKGKFNAEFHCYQATVNQDIQYSEIGVIFTEKS